MKEKELKEKDTPKKKTIALKTSTDSDDSDDKEDEDLAFLTRKFKRFMRKEKIQRKWSKSSFEKTKVHEEEHLCFKYNKPGHVKKDCSLLKMKTLKKDKRDKRENKKKVIQVTWDESDSTINEESTNDRKVAHMCFLALDNEVSSLSNIEDFNHG